jgi:hypothetical protein
MSEPTTPSAGARTARRRAGTDTNSTRRRRTERGRAAMPPAEDSAAASAAPGEGDATPLEVQLATMNALFVASKKNGKIVDIEKARKACDIAKLAAPYVHARLSSVDGPAGEGPRHEDVLDQLD